MLLQNDDCMGAIPLSGYKLTHPTTEEVNKKAPLMNLIFIAIILIILLIMLLLQVDKMGHRVYVIKLTHVMNPAYLFELPNIYDFEK